MMMKPKFEKPQMVRGVVVVGDRYDGMVSIDNENCAVARTFWYRHDDDLRKLETELDRLARVLTNSAKGSGASLWYEYRDYKAE